MAGAQRSAPPEEPKADVASSDKGAARSAAVVTAGIILSRLVGLVRQRVAAHYFGTSIFADILAAAFRVGNITQNLLGEGTLSASFIPVYAKLRAEGRPKEASHFALSALGLLLVVVVMASIMGVVFAPWLTWAVAAGFEGEKLESTVRVVRVVFPMTGVLVLAAWALGVLNAHRRFFLPYAAPVIWSLAQIAALLIAGAWLHQTGEPLAMAVAWGALVGAGLQLLLLLPTTGALLGSLRPRFDTKDKGVREAAKRLPGALIGRGVVQISGLIDTLLVSFLGPGANATFGYAQTIYLLPMSLLGTGEAAAALPEMSRDTAGADVAVRNKALQTRIGGSLSRIVVITLPTTGAFLFLGDALITLLLQTGSFDAESTSLVAPVLAAYGCALLANASVRVLATACYALGDTKTPARYAVVRVIASTAVSLALMQSYGVLGVVSGAVTAAWVEAVALGLRVNKEIGGLGLSQIKAGRVAVLTAVSVGTGVLLKVILPGSWTTHPLGAAAILAGFGGAFAIAAPLLGLFDVRSLLRRKR